ncbi:MAG: hypothetical protein K2K27_07170 [Muribaculaceae bacterium]|nr:hypothetical protein [Muribaculaceae bacterium]
MKVYFIRGDMDFGKTSACRKLREKLIDKNFSELCYGALEWENDFYSVFNIGDKKVGIYSAGDYGSILREALKFGANNNCDIFICPVRTNIKYNKPINDCLTQGKDTWEWIYMPSFDTEDERVRNAENLAQQIFELIS